MGTPQMTVKRVPGGLAAWLDLDFAGLGLGADGCTLRRSRMREIQSPKAGSDAQLARIAITREDIPGHVFRDLFN